MQRLSCFLLLAGLFLLVNAQSSTSKAPFKGVDKLCTNQWWKHKSNDIINLHVSRDSVIAFGLYTVSEGTLKLSAQLFPLYPDESREVMLEISIDGQWKEIQRQEVNVLGWSALFRVENWDHTQDIPYRLRHAGGSVFEGLVRQDPIDKSVISMAALSCNSKKDRDRKSVV